MEIIWPGRWEAALTIFNLRGWKDVYVPLYQHDMTMEEATGILSESISDWCLDDRYTDYILSYVEGTFDNLQVPLLKKFFARHESELCLHINPAQVPMQGHDITTGPSARTVGGKGGWFNFEENADYDLPFRVHGVYDIRAEWYEWVGESSEGMQ